jgi:Mn2+/Fe2+ NRAMP family transporter
LSWPRCLNHREEHRPLSHIRSCSASRFDFAPLDPIKALYWSAIINGIVAAPVMVVLMILVRQQKIMGQFVVRGWLYGQGWASMVAMGLCIVGMGIGLVNG